jgi:site-specific DNA-cytosine methylase
MPVVEERVFPITTNAFRLAWGRLRARAGLRDLRFHDLRHEAISCFFEHGLSMPEVDFELRACPNLPETARLMGLPDAYALPHNYNDAYHLTGDGVAVPVVRHLAGHLLEPLAQRKAGRDTNAVRLQSGLEPFRQSGA